MKRSLFVCLALALGGCPSDPPPPVDAPMGDTPATAMCPTRNVPNAEETMLPCCYRVSQASNHDAPEARLRYLDIVAPVGSPLTNDTVVDLLNTSLREETLQWLFRVEGADADGPVTITTGFGRRDATGGTYTFSTGAAPDMPAWAPVMLTGTLTGETLTSEPLDGALTVPIFDEAMTTLQMELELNNVSVLNATWTSDRSCVGTLRSALTFETGATLGGYVRVDSAQAGMINFPGIMTTLCGAIAGDLLDANYCDQPQTAWAVPPDSLCDDTGCHRNGMGATCDATTCNAWYLEADFAAVGVEIN